MVQMDVYDDVQRMQAADHLHGLEILDVLARHGWTSARAKRYVPADLFEFAGARIKAMAEARDKAGLPSPPSPPPDDPTGVHVFGYAR